MERREAIEIRTAMGKGDWERCRELRQQVFVEEQACPPEEEFDGHDAESRHLLAWKGRRAVGTARWRVVERRGERWAKLERFAVVPEERGHGLGRRLVLRTLEDARRAGHRRFLLHAQAHLQRFYEELGFERRGEGFEEAGIPHLRMVRVEPADPAKE
jgi:predicted GNAT family N-acyltransferase